MRINIGDSIKWVSAAGTLEGTVRSIKLDLNAAGDRKSTRLNSSH